MAPRTLIKAKAAFSNLESVYYTRQYNRYYCYLEGQRIGFFWEIGSGWGWKSKSETKVFDTPEKAANAYAKQWIETSGGYCESR